MAVSESLTAKFRIFSATPISLKKQENSLSTSVLNDMETVSGEADGRVCLFYLVYTIQT